MATKAVSAVLRNLLKEYVKGDATRRKQLEEEYVEEFKKVAPLLSELKKLQREQILMKNRHKAIKKQEESLKTSSSTLTKEPETGQVPRSSATALADLPSDSTCELGEVTGDFVQDFLVNDNDIFGGTVRFDQECKVSNACLRKTCQLCQPPYCPMTLSAEKRGSVWLGGECSERLAKRIKVCAHKEGLKKVERTAVPFLSLAVEIYVRNAIENQIASGGEDTKPPSTNLSGRGRDQCLGDTTGRPLDTR